MVAKISDQVNSMGGIVARRRDRDAEICRRLTVDGRVSRSRPSNALQGSVTAGERPFEGCAFAHDAHYIERSQPFDEGRRIGHMVVEHDDLGLPTDIRLVSKPQRSVLVIVEDGNLHFNTSVKVPRRGIGQGSGRRLGLVLPVVGDRRHALVGKMAGKSGLN
jgi:hypothetical protein